MFHVNHYTHDILLAILELNELRWRFVSYEFKKELIWIGVVIHTCNPSTQGTETKTKTAKSLRPAWSQNKENGQNRDSLILDIAIATADVKSSNSQPV